jgi:hemerythrin-like domain-containing protein
MAMPYWLEKLEASHRRHDEHMRALVASTRRIAQGGFTGDDQRVIEDAVDFLLRSVPRHFADEEETLFPRVRTLRPELADEIDRIVTEHREHEAHHMRLAALWAKASGGDRSAARGLDDEAQRLASLYERHVADEDALFVRLQELFTDGDDHAMQQEMERRRGRGGGGGGGGGGGRGGGGGGRGGGGGGGRGGGGGGGRGGGGGGGGRKSR